MRVFMARKGDQSAEVQGGRSNPPNHRVNDLD